MGAPATERTGKRRSLLGSKRGCSRPRPIRRVLMILDEAPGGDDLPSYLAHMPINDLKRTWPALLLDELLSAGYTPGSLGSVANAMNIIRKRLT